MRVSLCFPVHGNSCMRIEDSMRKHLPDDVEIMNVWTRYGPNSSERPDLIFGHMSGLEWAPQWAYISPKIMLTEAVDDAILSFFTDKDILLTYSEADVQYARSKDVNAIRWAVPVDEDIFYKEDVAKRFDLLFAAPHNDWFERACTIAESVNAQILFLGLRPLPVEKTDWIEQDFCFVRRDEDKLRRYYSESKFCVGILTGYEYFPGRFGFGFEGSVPEAAFCGCRPIILDDPRAQYLRNWCGGFADFVKADSFEQDLVELLTDEYVPLSEDKIKLAKEIFNTANMWKKVWDEVRNIL